MSGNGGAQRPWYVPAATYRLQVHGQFPLSAATGIVDYLQRLGVTTVYTSPYFTAVAGSTHGYDVCNHNEISPEVGGNDALRDFTATIAAAGMGHVVDFVPNHMGVGAGGNAWWTDVLENGPSSPAASFFDIDWAPLKAELHAKLLLPILGDQYGKVLERGELRLEFRDGVLLLRYFDAELPINPRQTPRVYRGAVEPLTAELGADNPALHEFLSILSSLENLPPYTEQDATRIAERHREKEVAKSRLQRLSAESPVIARCVHEAVAAVNGTPGNPSSFNALHELLESQPYRLSYWRTASHEINYRRFFDINTLVGIRVERQEVFDETHRLLGELIRGGQLQGIRVDHPDGLFDPARYFEMLQALARDAAGVQAPLYVVAEKILSGREQLPRQWDVHGTTGYNFLNDLNGLFIDASQQRRLRRTYAKLTGHADPFDDVLYEAKRLIMTTAMASELSVLAHMLDRIGESNRRSRDFTLESMRDVIIEVVACFPVYRTYVEEQGWTPEDRRVVEQAISRARRRNPAMEASLFDFFREVMLPRDPNDQRESGPERREGYPPADAAEARERRRFAMKLQQYTGPVQAKGLEDTAFYRYNVLVSLNEVGGDPAQVGRPVEDFHGANLLRARHWPYEMLATATHDTKLGEDVRARINVLSELNDEWAREVAKWMRINRPVRSIVDGEPVPDRVDEYRLYQILAGTWPPSPPGAVAGPYEGRTGVGPGSDPVKTPTLPSTGRKLEEADPSGVVSGSDPGTTLVRPRYDPRTAPGGAYVNRIKEYMLKAVREAKVHSSWLTPNQGYEDGLMKFIDGVLGRNVDKFLPAFLPFQQRIALLGMTNSLAQVMLKVGSPGVPDFYQGTELWDLSLVDPDNRRPVDFVLRDRLLRELDAAGADAIPELLANWQDGRIKLFVTAASLRVRRELPDVFAGGEYVPLTTNMTVSGDIVAFARTAGTDAVIVVAPRLCAALDCQGPPLGADCWKTSRLMLPPSLRELTFRNVFTNVEIKPTVGTDDAWIFVGQLFAQLPVALLRSV
jgi:malto-oligosyltrehalose synthase